ncbi:MAG: hypothetical protein M9887_06890 [Chitinophagales bacterium]|nr:hypothetical protein [Chitinophagales bacterium]
MQTKDFIQEMIQFQSGNKKLLDALNITSDINALIQLFHAYKNQVLLEEIKVSLSKISEQLENPSYLMDKNHPIAKDFEAIKNDISQIVINTVM